MNDQPIEETELLRLDILIRLQKYYEVKEWGSFRVVYLYYKLLFPEDAKLFCEHMPGDARNHCLDIIDVIEDGQV